MTRPTNDGSLQSNRAGTIHGMETYLILGTILILVSFFLMAVELFVPTGGLFFILAFSAMIVGVGMTFFYDGMTGVMFLLGACILMPLAFGAVLHYWPKMIGKDLAAPETDGNSTLATTPMNQELELLRGRFGKTLSDLRPAGVVDFDGKRIDTVTEGMMVEAGRWVRCVDVRAGRVVVRAAERPKLDDLETADFS